MDYEKAYTDALLRAKQAIKECGDNESQKKMIEGIFPELASKDEKIREWCISHFRECINVIKDNDEYKEYLNNEVIAWLEKQGHDGKKWIYEDVYLKEKEQLIQDGIDEVLDNPQKYGLEKQCEQNNIVEQLAAFAQHLNKRGAFRDDLCMDFEHEAQSFIEMQKFNATQLGV